MNDCEPLQTCLKAAVALALGTSLAAASGAFAADITPEAVDTYRPLGLMNRLPQTASGAGQAGTLRLGLATTSQDNYRFGQYNGQSEQKLTLIGDLQWRDFHDGDHYWQVSLNDIGLDTREGRLTWGQADKLRLSVGFDSQQQVRNNTGKTPFSGDAVQTLPGDWAAGLTTGSWSALEQSLQPFDRELQRERLFLEVQARLSDNWRMESRLSYEEKEGDGDIGAGIYIDAASADAVLLRAPVEHRSSDFDLSIIYEGEKLHLTSQVAYADFDNRNELLTWQNPYSSYGAGVAYAQGVGGVALAPDNQQTSARITGQYVFSATTRLQFDGSYALAEQHQDFAQYSVNPALAVTQALPRNDYDGEVGNTTGSLRLLLRPKPRLNAEIFYKVRDRDYDTRRDAWLYVRGDGGDQPGSAFTVYNTTHDRHSQSAGFEVSYRLPARSKLSAEYVFEEVTRENAAVEETQEDRYTLRYRIAPRADFSARLQLTYADRAADTYEWSQSYYALLDTDLINATPDNQRFNNHPLLRQFHLSNRERYEGKLELTYLPASAWNLNLNLMWREDDYDASELGLTASEWGRAHFSASYATNNGVSVTAYAGVDRYRGDQSSRAFRGGQEKNAFAIYAPLPQASDPAQNWDLETTDTSVTVGVNVNWQVSTDLALQLDYNLVDSNSSQDFTTVAGGNLAATDLPDVDTLFHLVEASGVMQLQENLSLELAYKFHHYKTNDWAWDNVQANTIDKVLTFGQTNPNDDIHYVGAAIIYHWR